MQAYTSIIPVFLILQTVSSHSLPKNEFSVPKEESLEEFGQPLSRNMQNFDEIVAKLEENAKERDGGNIFDGFLQLSASDQNQETKKYKTTIEEMDIHDVSKDLLDQEESKKQLIRFRRSESNNTSVDDINILKDMDDDELLKTEFGSTRNRLQNISPTDKGSGDGNIIGTTSDYVLIAMIVAMMFCMTLCCLCLFCRSSSRLSICGINFELNDRRNSLNAGEDLSEIHEVVPLTPTTADNNRLPDIESILRADAPPPLYSEIIRKNTEKGKLKRKSAVALHDEGKTQEQIAKENEAKGSTKSSKKNSRVSTQTSVERGSESGSNGARTSWKLPGFFSSFRAKSSLMRQRRSDSALGRHSVEEGLPPPRYHSNQGTPIMCRKADEGEGLTMGTGAGDVVTMETVNEVVKETEDENEAKRNKVFVYDVSELPDDDDVFL